MNIAETKICTSCKLPFSIEPDDFTFYEKFGVPPPSKCPLCRAQLRLAFKNERSYYKRSCDKCKRDVVSMYSPNKPYTVWCYECWFADDWDARDYARSYDPKRSFIEQFEELWNTVPKMALIYARSVRSDYVNISADNKDCYMIVESSNNEGCTHCYWIQQCRDCVDVSFAHNTELSYESDDCYNSYQLFYSKGCTNARESYFLLNCRDCSNCIGCVNLRSKQYCVFNEQLSKDEYEKIIKDARLDTESGVTAFRAKFQDFVKSQPLRYAEIYNAPHSSGNYIKDAKNCVNCFHSYDAEDCRHSVHVWRNAKNCMDCDTVGRNAELVYNSINAGIDTSHYVGAAVCWSCSFMEYSYYCFNSNHCFGSTGLRKQDYCILNKQYERAEFEALRETIVANMEVRGEYGEFFPARLSAFGYNESAAQEQFPLTKEQALVLGFKWEETQRGTFGKETVQWKDVPDSINELGVGASVGASAIDPAKEIFACVACSKNYRIIPSELAFYKRFSIPLPRLCPDCRHARRFAARGPNQLFARTCSCVGAKSADGRYANTVLHNHGAGMCQNTFTTNHSSKYDGIIYCEECYQNEVV